MLLEFPLQRERWLIPNSFKLSHLRQILWVYQQLRFFTLTISISSLFHKVINQDLTSVTWTSMVNLWHHLMNKIWIIIHFQQTTLIVLPLIYLWEHQLIWIPLKILSLHQTKCRTRIRINSQNKTLLLFWGNVKENLKEISLYLERSSRKNWCGQEKK